MKARESSGTILGRAGPWALLAALTVMLFWPLLLHRQHLVPFHVFAGDPALAGLDRSADRPDWKTYDPAPVTVQYAEKRLFAGALRDGEFALWNPYNGLGMPLLADGQSQPLALFFLPFLAWPTPWVYSLVLVVQLLFGGLGMERLLARLQCGGWARTLGAAAFAFNPYTLKYLAYSDVWAYVWFPWVFWAAEALARRRTGPLPMAVAIALMALSGHPEAALMGAAAGVVYFAIRALTLEGRKGLLRPATAVVPLMALLLSAWWVLPFLEWIRGSWSPRMGSHVPVTYSPSAWFLQGSELLWLPGLLLLALAGLRRSDLAKALAPLLLWAGVLLLPLPPSLQHPFDLGFMSGRYTRSLAWFALVLLAALGLEEWAKGLGRGFRWSGVALASVWAGLAVAFGTAPMAALAEGHRVPMDGSPASASPALWLLAIVALVLWLMPHRLINRSAPLFAAAFCACVLGGTVLFTPAHWASWNRSKPSLAPAIANHEPMGHGRVWLPHEGLRQDLPPNLSCAFRLRDVRYVSPVTPKRLVPVAGDLALGFQGFLDWREATMDFVGVNLAWRQSGPGLSPEPNPKALPRGFWVADAEVAADSSEALREALQGGAWRRKVYLEPGAPIGVSGTADDLEESSEIRIRPTLDTCNASAWKVHGPTAGWFILRDLYWPGWRAEVDGRPVRVLAADGLFRAVALPSGDHTVAFRYAPSSLRWGLALTLLCGAALLGSLLVGRFGARRMTGA